MKEVFAYGRVSMETQNLDMQLDRFKLYGIKDENVYAEKDSGAKNDRKELQKLLNVLRSGDKIVFDDLSRVGRNLLHLLTLIQHFEKQKIDFLDLTNPAINTENVRTTGGYMIFVMTGLFAEIQRRSSNEKVIRGIEAARRRGKFGGRPKGLSAPLKEKAPLVAIMYKDPTTSISQISKTLKMAPASVYKCLKHEGIDISLIHKGKGNNNRNKNSKIEIKQ